MHHLVILNPAAGNGVAGTRESLLRRLLDRHRIAYDLVRTDGPMHAARLAREADPAGVVVAAGGDGTCNEIINGLMEIRGPRPAVGVLCTGRGNDFAFAAGIPLDIEEGVRSLAAGRRRLLDVGRLSGCGSVDPRYFCNGLGIGFDAIVSLEAAKMKRIRGFIGYILSALKTIVLFPEAPRVRVRFADLERRQHATQISLMIGPRMGGAFFMSPGSLPDDGQIDLCLAGRVGRSRMIRLFFKFLKGTQVGEAGIETARGERFEVTAEEGALFVHADGEAICSDARSLVAECMPQAIEVVTGAGGAAGS